MRKTRFVLALLCAMAVCFGFAGCSSDDDDDDDSSSTVSTWKSNDDEYETVYFYNDNTFVVHEKGSHYYSEYGFTLYLDFDDTAGTWSGSFSSGSTVSLTVTKSTSEEEAIEVMKSKINAAVAAGKTSCTLTNSDFPLEAVSETKTLSATISGSTATVTVDSKTKTWTLQ